jgi:hypothetical protein
MENAFASIKKTDYLLALQEKNIDYDSPTP